VATSNMDCLTPVDWPPLRDAARKAPVDGPMTANEHKAVITTRPEFKLCCVTTVNPMGLGCTDGLRGVVARRSGWQSRRSAGR
jgi:hypothetical protein